MAALGKLTELVFEKPRKKIIQNVTLLKEFKQVNFHQRPDLV